jgi:hypothetical protein
MKPKVPWGRIPFSLERRLLSTKSGLVNEKPYSPRMATRGSDIQLRGGELEQRPAPGHALNSANGPSLR